MNNQTVNELQKCAKLNKYFWNGLFAVIYEERRYEIPIGALTAGEDENYWIHETISTIKNYLSCKHVLDFSRFKEFCSGIHCNILDRHFIELLPLVNKAYAYLEEQDFTNGKVSKSKKYRQKILEQADMINDDTYMLEQQIAQDEWEHAKILEIFNDLTEKELSLLYLVADGYNYTHGCDDFFMEHFFQLNENGQALFKEALEVEYSQQNNSIDDEMCMFCRIMAVEKNTNIKAITPNMLYEKLEKIGFSSPEDAQKLKNYRYAETDTWVVLELFHKVMLAYADENIEDLPFGEKDCLLILLNWLVDIPSLRKQSAM
ncbi:hypothetical protein MSB04_04915 [bacterium]|nr:hypothetical protein [bacterium]